MRLFLMQIFCQEKVKKLLTGYDKYVNLNELLKYRIQNNLKEKIKKVVDKHLSVW